MHVIMNGVRQDLFYPRARETLDAQRWGLPPDAFVFAYIGTHGMAHDLSRFLGMAARFQVSHPQVYFLFVGEGAEKNQLMAQAQSLGLSHCIFLPKQDKADIPKIWSCVDVALVSLREDPVLATAMPSKIFEAMAMGKPVFFKGPQGVASSFIEREGIGQCDLGSNPEAMYDFMLQFLDPLRYTAWSEAALKAVPRYRREAQAMAGLRVLASCL